MNVKSCYRFVIVSLLVSQPLLAFLAYAKELNSEVLIEQSDLSQKWATIGGAGTKGYLVESQFPHKSLKLPLTVVLSEQSPWTVYQVLDLVRVTETVYFHQCEISIFPIVMITLPRSPLDKINPNDDSSFTNLIPEDTQFPLIGFTNTFEVAKFVVGYANKVGKLFGEGQVENTIFISYRGFDLFANNQFGMRGVVAHEIGHLLLNGSRLGDPRTNHSSEYGNLMGLSANGLNLNPEQCDFMKTSPLLIR